MNIKTVVTFLLGAAVGVAASWHFAQKKWQAYADEDIKSVKEAYARKLDEKNGKSDNTPPDVSAEKKKEYAEVISNLGYRQNEVEANRPAVNYSGIVDLEEREIKDLPYVIRDDLYGSEGYEQIAYIYNINTSANERELIEESTQKEENELKILGEDVIDYIDNQAEFTSDNDVQEICVVHVRDDILKIDYEITCNRW